MQKALDRKLRVQFLEKSKCRSLGKHSFSWVLKNFISVYSLCCWVVRDGEFQELPEPKIVSAGTFTKCVLCIHDFLMQNEKLQKWSKY